MLNVSPYVIIAGLLLLMLVNGLLVGYRIGIDRGYRQRNKHDTDLTPRQ